MPSKSDISSGLNVKRGPGRPPGTGPKQRAAQLALAQGETIHIEKRPVGRPRKLPRLEDDAISGDAVRVDLGKTVCSHLYLL